jgi:hypothetical protein
MLTVTGASAAVHSRGRYCNQQSCCFFTACSESNAKQSNITNAKYNELFSYGQSTSNLSFELLCECCNQHIYIQQQQQWFLLPILFVIHDNTVP